MTEEDIKLIEQISPFIANNLRQDKDSDIYKATLEVVESPDFQKKLDVLREKSNADNTTSNEPRVQQNYTVLSDTPDGINSFPWGMFFGIFGSATLFIVLLFTVIHFTIVKIVRKRKKDTVYVCTCTKCKNTREEKYENVFKGLMGGMTRYSEKYKMKKPIGVGIGMAYYNHYQKKIYCPTCNKKTWHEIENINDVMYDGHPGLKEARDRMFKKEMNKQ